jgi:phage portal protein BeeE
MPWQWPWTRTQDRALWQVGDLPVASTYAAVPVNPSTAMQHSAVWACVNLIAGSISTLPLAAYRDGDPNPLPGLPPILRAPSAGWTLPDFTYACLQSLLLRGNAYGLIVDRAGAGLLPAQVELLAPERVQVEVNSRTIWRLDGEEVDPASVWHVKAFTAPGQVLGLSPIQHARQAIGLGLGAEKFAAKLFGESAIPSGILTTDQDIKHERAEELKPAGGSGTPATETSPSSATAPASRPSPSPPRKPSSSRRPRRTSAPSPATTASSPSSSAPTAAAASPTPTWNSGRWTSSPSVSAPGW